MAGARGALRDARAASGRRLGVSSSVKTEIRHRICEQDHLVPEGLERVDRHCSTRWNPAGGRGEQDEAHRDDGERCGIRRLNLEQQRLEHPRYRERRREADRHPDRPRAELTG